MLRNGQFDCRNPRRRYRRATAMKDTTRATVITIPLFLAGTVFGCIDRTILVNGHIAIHFIVGIITYCCLHQLTLVLLRFRREK